VLVVEHPPTITFGVREDINLLAVDRKVLGKRGVALVKTNRGGGATVHSPGQIVCYPILDLQRRSLRVDEYIALLEDIGIRLLEKLGVTAHRREGFPGLWVKASSGDDAIPYRKIASIGIHLAGMVTAHGMAVNIRNDLAMFNYIIPCGIDGVSMTSVREETGTEHDMAEVKRLLVECVKEHLTPGGATSEEGPDDASIR
jgi:lipoate-protein ligase B